MCKHSFNRVTYWVDKMKNEKYHTVRTVPKYHTVRTVPKYHTVRTVPKSNRKMVETEAQSLTHLHDHSLSWLGTSIKTDVMSLVEQEMPTLPEHLSSHRFLMRFVSLGL